MKTKILKAIVIGVISVLIIGSISIVVIKVNLFNQVKSIINIDKNLDDKIDRKLNKQKIDKIELERKLQQVNVEIVNTSIQALGSGVSLKYNGKFYVLSAGHMVDKETDALELWENGKKICDLEVVKHAFTSGLDDGDFTVGDDLVLLRPKNKYMQPKYYVELANQEPPTSTELYIVGNPAGIEDVLCEGRIINYKNKYMHYINHTYFGNSGGGVYSTDGKLIGIVSYLYPLQMNPFVPPYMIYGAVRLNTIIDFLKDVK